MLANRSVSARLTSTRSVARWGARGELGMGWRGGGGGGRLWGCRPFLAKWRSLQRLYLGVGQGRDRVVWFVMMVLGGGVGITCSF